jgi:type II secretion system protein G
MQHFKKRGFTLIELLVVISIIGILASIVISSLDSSRKKGRDARRLSDIKQIQLALEVYYDQNSSFPSQIANSLTCNTSYGASCATNLTGPGYIPVVPRDPSDNHDYDYAPYAANGSVSPCISYHLGAALETQGHSALNSDKDMPQQNGSAGQPFTLCTGGGPQPGAADFNNADTGKCNNVNDYGSYCYDVIP